jgi:hypothetical protein
MIRSRDGVVSTGKATVYIEQARERVVGILPYTEQDAELINVAVLRKGAVSSLDRAISASVIKAYGPAQTVRSGQLTCSVDAGSPTTVLSVTGCVVKLDGTQTSGGDVKVKVEYTVGGSGTSFSGLVPFRVHYPSAVRVELQHTRKAEDVLPLRPIAGWFDESDSSCKTLRFETVVAKVFADFSLGGSSSGTTSTFAEFDVSSFVTLKVDNAAVATVAKSSASDVWELTGVGKGSAVLSCELTNLAVQVFAESKAIEVADPTDIDQLLGVVGIHTEVFTAPVITPSTSPATIGRGEEFIVSTGLTAGLGGSLSKPFTLEDQTSWIAFWAVFHDGSTKLLNDANGLDVSAFYPETLTIDPAQQKLVVPKSRVGMYDELVQAK